MTSHVIVGNGVAGMEAALELRRREPFSRIALVSDEHDHLFSRPALMYVFAKQLRLQDTEPYDCLHYEKHGLERVRGRVARLEAGAQALVLEDGRRIEYDRLLLATGSRARPAPWPGSAGPGVHGFVTLRDLEGLDAEARPGQRAVVIGGGLIGVEVAEILHDRKLSVTFLIRESWYFPLALEPRESALVAEHMKGHGVDVRVGSRVESILRSDDGRPRAVRLEGDPVEIPCTLVACCIGVEPNTSFLRDSGLALSNQGAIETDDALCTNLPQVWAAGDCANVSWPDGSRRPEQLWYTARDQGRVAARSMLGEPVTYRRGALYNSAKFFDLEWTSAGDLPAKGDEPGSETGTTTRTADGTGGGHGHGARGRYGDWFQRVPGRAESQRIVVEGERVVGFNLIGSRWDHERLLRWIDEKRTLDWVLQHMAEAQFDEELSPRFRVWPGAVRR